MISGFLWEAGAGAGALDHGRSGLLTKSWMPDEDSNLD